MAKDKTEIKEELQEVREDQLETKFTYCYLHSKANFNIPIKLNGATVELAPFGKLKVIKEQLELDSQFAKYLSITKV